MERRRNHVAAVKWHAVEDVDDNEGNAAPAARTQRNTTRALLFTVTIGRQLRQPPSPTATITSAASGRARSCWGCTPARSLGGRPT